jgi:hypothetical protein
MTSKSQESLILRARECRTGVESWLNWLLAKPWMSYVLILALQSKVVADIWRFRDLTTGDTSSYFGYASQWVDHFGVNIIWSPLYTAFYGTVLLAVGDTYYATTLHRVLIVFAATLGVLALMRQLLPPALALLIAAWWAVLPINFETLYEVHLFALLPIIAAWLVMTIDDKPWTRGSALAILFVTTVLVRNEQIIALAIFAVICAIREYRMWRTTDKNHAPFWKVRIVAYGLPLLAAACFCGAAYWRSDIKSSAILAAADGKHSLNMCQVYAFGYAQRHPEWTLSPWTECSPLMRATFGSELPSFAQMIASNPAAVFEHVLWNLSLTLSGFQVSLFNTMSGKVNPDYVPVISSRAALYLSVAVVLVFAAGAFKAARQWEYWWSAWFQERRGVWLIMLAELSVALPVIITQRPRPSYLFPATVVIMAAIGSAVHVLLRAKGQFIGKVFSVICIFMLVIAVPSYYSRHRSDRPLYANYERIRSFAGVMSDPKNRILFGDYNGEFRGYLNIRGVITFDYSILSLWRSPQSLEQFLDSQGINIIFVQPRVMPELGARPEARQLLEQPEALGWRRLAPTNVGDENWLLLYREP